MRGFCGIFGPEGGGGLSGGRKRKLKRKELRKERSGLKACAFGGVATVFGLGVKNVYTHSVLVHEYRVWGGGALAEVGEGFQKDKEDTGGAALILIQYFSPLIRRHV